MNDDVVVIDLEKAVRLYLSDKAITCRPETVQTYSERIRYFVSYMCDTRQCEAKDISMISITLADLKSYNLYLAKRPAFEKHPFSRVRSHAISETSRYAYTNDLKIFMRWAYQESFLNFDVAGRFKLVKKDKQEILPLYQDDVDKIDACFNLRTETGLRNWCMVHIMLDAGLRKKEVIQLRLKDLNFEKNYIYVDLGKGNKSRYIFFPAKLQKNLYRYVTIYRGAASGEYVFVQLKNHEPINSSVIGNFFSRLKARSGVENLYPHLLRHTFASAFVLGGGDIRTLQLIMGHESIKVTERYVHVANNYRFLNDNVYKLDKGFIKRYY